MYWVGSADTYGNISDAVHPSHLASPGFYEIDQGWLNTFWLELARAAKSIRVQVHTHAGAAFHSATDDAWPVVHSRGFASLVLPDYALEDDCLDRAYLAEFDGSGNWTEHPVGDRVKVA